MTITRLGTLGRVALAGMWRRRERRREIEELYSAAVNAFDRGDMARFIRLFDRYANTEDL